MSSKKNSSIVYLKKGADLKEEIFTYKIGCTGFSEKRLKPDNSSGFINTSIIKSFPGDFATEKAVHLYFREYRIPYGKKENGEEIFQKIDYILEEFSRVGKEKELLYLNAWEKRDSLFLPNQITYDSEKFNIREQVLGRAIKLIGIEKALEDVREDYKNIPLNIKINNFIVTKYKINKNNKMFNLY